MSFAGSLRKGSAPPTSPLARRRTVEAGLERHIMEKVGDRVPNGSRADFETWLRGTIHAAVLGGPALTKKDLADLEARAEAVVEKLNTTVERFKAVKIAAPPAAAPASRGSANAQLDEGVLSSPGFGARRPVTAPERDSPASAGGVGQERPKSTPSLPSPLRESGRVDFMGISGGAATAPGGIIFSPTGAFDASGKPLPELEHFRKLKRKVATREGLYGQMAEHQTNAAREKFVKQAYIAADDEILRRALEAAERKKQEERRKIAEDAAMVRSQLVEREAQKKADEAKARADDEATLAKMMALYEADQAKFQAMKKKEKEALMASKRENDVLRALRAEMDRQAAEEQKRLLAEKAAKEVAAEAAHRDKYKHIAEQQERLGELLMEATRAHREKMDSFYTRQQEEADAQYIRNMEKEARAKAARKERIMDQLAVIKEQMRVKAEAAAAEKADNRKLAVEGRAEILAAVESRKAEKRASKQKLREYAKELERQAALRAAALAAPPQDKYKFYASETFQGTSLPTNTTSSDWDTENLFKRTLHPPPTSGNRSDEIAPLLGFGAPFVTKIETEGTVKPVEVPSPEKAVASLQPHVPGADTHHANLRIKGSTLKPSQALAAAAAAAAAKTKK